MVMTCGTENFQQTNYVRTTSSFLIPFQIIQYLYKFKNVFFSLKNKYILCIYNYMYIHVHMVLMHNAIWISAILVMNVPTEMLLKVNMKLTEWYSCAIQAHFQTQMALIHLAMILTVRNGKKCPIEERFDKLLDAICDEINRLICFNK